MAFLETPSRILRRMEALEAQDSNLPSLPSMPAFEDSAIRSLSSTSAESLSPVALRISDNEDEDDVPYHSTPAPASSQTTRSTMRPPPSTMSSATRFANSMRTSITTTRKSQIEHESFEVSHILHAQHYSDSSSASVPDVYLPPENDTGDLVHMQHDMEGELSLGNDVESVSRSPSSLAVIAEEQHRTPGGKKYDYSISLRSEPKPSPINSHRSMSIPTRPMSRTRTPSLSRTTPSPTSVSSNSTPRSTYSHRTRDVTSPELLESEDSRLGPAVTAEQDHVQVSETENEQPLPVQEAPTQADLEGEYESYDERRDGSPEPTFSSDEEPQSSGTPSARTPYPAAFSSLAPTPAQVPRATTPVDATLFPAGSSTELGQDLATPYNRRRSFLLSLVHSTTRPRMALPTPHPHTRVAPTPRPHPLSQAWTPISGKFARESDSNPSSGSSLSPHDRLSFISTASSHDLTVHPRANASFDPVTGAKGVARFNAVKLNTYLHGLNRRLQEENELLVDRLRMHGEEVKLGVVAEALEREDFKNIEEAVLREMETLRDEVVGHEQEKATVTAERDAMRGQLEVLRSEIEGINAELQSEQQERMRDKERWKGRMVEVESGIENVIKELERRLEEAERDAKEAEDEARKLKEKYAVIQGELDIVNTRAEKAEHALANSSGLGTEFKLVNDRMAAYIEELRATNERADGLKLQLRDAEQNGEQVKASLEDQLARVGAELRHSLEAQHSAQAHARELEAQGKAAEEIIENLEEQLASARENAVSLLSENNQLRARMENLKEDTARAAESARQMEDALEESERKMISDEEELASLRSRLGLLERERESAAQRELSKSATSPGQDPSSLRGVVPAAEAEQLEAELDVAHREIAKLNYLLSESPSRKAIEKAKDMRIELLEKEKDELCERVRALRSMMPSPSPGHIGSPAMSTPAAHRRILESRSSMTPGPPLKDYSWLRGNITAPSASPLVAQIEHLQQELDLANNSIDAKVDKLEEAGMDIVGLTEKLEHARTRIIALEQEVARLTRREDRRAQRVERARCVKCGGRIDFNKFLNICEADQSSAEPSLTSLRPDLPSPPSETIEALQAALQTVNSQLHTLKSKWEGERQQLLGEKAILQDAANRLNMELGAVKNEVQQVLETGRQDADQQARARTNLEVELDKVKTVANDLEDALRSERSRLRALSSEQKRVGREKESILTQLQRGQSDMDDVKLQLEKIRRDNRELEAELRATTIAEQRARLLETKVLDNQNAIEQLRKERESLAADHADLKHRYVEASAHVNRLRQELATSQKSHDERRHQLDLRMLELEGLRHELAHQAHELERIESEKNKARADRRDIVNTVASLESDLRHVRNDAEALGRDLRELKTERDRLEIKHKDELGKADRMQKQLYAQVRVANEQLEVQREKAKKAVSDLESHVCESNKHDFDKLRMQHKDECKGLMVQIRYLKAMVTRESLFRADMGYQKHYLLSILASFEKSEEQILAAVARIGFPSPQNQPIRKRRTLRGLAVAALFIVKARKTSEVWREQIACRSAVGAALQDVRRRRVSGSRGHV